MRGTMASYMLYERPTNTMSLIMFSRPPVKILVSFVLFVFFSSNILYTNRPEHI